MFYPIALHAAEDGYVVQIPDVPGCFSAGDTFAEALENAKEALIGHIGLMVEDGEEIPQSSAIENYINDPEFEGWHFSGVEVDLSYLLGKTEKINITLPLRLIRRIDEFVARNPEYKSRSTFLAKVASDRVFAL